MREFEVDAAAEVLLPITWTPIEHGPCRCSIRVLVKDLERVMPAYRLNVHLLGDCPKPEPRRKVRLQKKYVDGSPSF